MKEQVATALEAEDSGAAAPRRVEGAEGPGRGLALTGVGAAPRICYVVESFYPPDVGGLQRHAHRLVERLAGRGMQVTVVARRFDPAAATRERLGTATIRRIPPSGQLRGKGWKALAPLLRFQAGVLRLLWSGAREYDVILVSGVKLLSIPAVLVSRMRGKKCVLKPESPIEVWEEVSGESLQKMGLPRSSMWLRLFRGARNGLWRSADGFISTSAEITDELVALGIAPAKIWLIPNGIDTNRFQPAPAAERARLRRALELPEDQVILIFTGRLAASKGLPLLMEVWKDLVQRHDDIHLLIVGSAQGTFDSCEEQIRGYVREQGLGQTVTLTGEVDNVQEYLQASDVFVFPSEYEGFGMSMAEALACALPAVLTRVGFAGEYIQSGTNGVLIDPGDRRQLREALEWLLDHRDVWAEMGERAREGIAARYGIDVTAELYRQVFSSLAGVPMQGPDRGRGRSDASSET